MNINADCPCRPRLVFALWETILGFQDTNTKGWLMKDKIKLALCQISSKREDKEANLQKIENLTLKAKQQGADLAIFPEMSLTGYVVLDQVYELAEPVPGPSVARVEALAKKTGMHVVFGMPELSEKSKGNHLQHSRAGWPKRLNWQIPQNVSAYSQRVRRKTILPHRLRARRFPN